jgi:rhodanese-related sulfurtransferase
MEMKEITAAALRDQLAQPNSLHLIDVRETYEHEDFNIGGKNIPLGELMEHEAELKSMAEKGDLVLYCRSGNRSLMAQKILAMRLGITNTINLHGGMIAWNS